MSFGAQHVIDVLQGRANERIDKFGHANVSTYGIGKEFSDAQWRAVLRQLIALHVVWVDAFRHNALRLGERVRELLRGNLKIPIRQTLLKAPKVRMHAMRQDGSRTEALESLSPLSRQIFEALRAWRRQTAQALGKPAYVIFPDRTLVQIALRRPSSLEDLMLIPGVGRRKLEHYGEEILDVVQAEC